MSEICWEAVSAIATFLAVVVALFIPYCEKLQRDKINTNIIEVVTNELKNNIKLIGKGDMESLKRINLNVWNEYKYQIVMNNPEFYRKCNDIYKDIDVLLSSLFNGSIHSLANFDVKKKYEILKKYNKFFKL
ncbi:hypothetical protein M0Q39_04890 [Patescibacteria group bacterium]|nr:hypothetical protein [Patescibacteria group bacterium]MDD3940106.1 hypothetical protein [Candidatus Paceibacterota bacterium]